MELIGIIVFFAAGFFLGEAIALYRMRKVLRELARSVGIDLDAELHDRAEKEDSPQIKVTKLITETHNDMIYLYDKENDDFICQGKTINELATLAKERKKIQAAVVLHGNRVFAFHNGISQEVFETKQ